MRCTNQISSVRELLPFYKGILLDAYGVFWAGNETGLLPGSKDAMEEMIKEGKIVGVLSNATRLGTAEIDKLERHGLTLGKHFLFLITSGDITRDILKKQLLPFSPVTHKFYVFGGPYPGKAVHQEIFAETVYTETTDLNEAGFIYVSTPQIEGKDQTDPKVFKVQVERCIEKKLPMLCANPDLFAHEGNPPKAVVRQGSIAKMYESLGGVVHYIGKPHKQAFYCAMQEFINHAILDPKDIVMVGDTPETDVRGANAFGMGSVLLTKTGIMADRLVEAQSPAPLQQLPITDTPRHFLTSLTL
jgi:HAD superfamily hydrolase (TIGR01459 family)